MNILYKTMALSGVNLLALATNPADATVLKPVFAGANQGPVHAMAESEIEAREASHLQVYAGCKWGHAAFDPIRIDSEEIPAEILALHAGMSAA